MGDFVAYWASHQDKFMAALGEHLVIVGVVLAWSLAVAALVTLAIRRSRRVEGAVLQVLGALYSVPSLALFSLLIPLTGLGLTSATIVMVAYNQFLLVRNIVEGLNGVDPGVVEAATGMGMSPMQVLLRVELPLAFPVIMAGIRLAAISTIGIATIAATINAGGLGTSTRSWTGPSCARRWHSSPTSFSKGLRSSLPKGCRDRDRRLRVRRV